ncbi:MAG TPA: hypothetical protein VGX25_30545, partial [Actinophytocola sp.]|uniref:hypothetical protein n=1 Tax=Actinophytocola sp. TaxID=1872138 RepID=UPI002DDD6B05
LRSRDLTMCDCARPGPSKSCRTRTISGEGEEPAVNAVSDLSSVEARAVRQRQQGLIIAEFPRFKNSRPGAAGA